MNVTLIPKFVPKATHPLAQGGYSVTFRHPDGGTARVFHEGSVRGMGASHDSPDGAADFGRTYQLFTTRDIRDATKLLDLRVSALLDARGGNMDDIRFGAAHIGVFAAAADGKDGKKFGITELELLAGDALSESVRDAALAVNRLVHSQY